jgi:hypothetical protein
VYSLAKLFAFLVSRWCMQGPGVGAAARAVGGGGGTHRTRFIHNRTESAFSGRRLPTSTTCRVGKHGMHRKHHTRTCTRTYTHAQALTHRAHEVHPNVVVVVVDDFGLDELHQTPQRLAERRLQGGVAGGRGGGEGRPRLSQAAHRTATESQRPRAQPTHLTVPQINLKHVLPSIHEAQQVVTIG